MKFESVKSNILDPAYGTDGVAYLDDSLISINQSISIGNKRLCVGMARFEGGRGYVLLRVDNKGVLDETFGSGGMIVGTFLDGHDSFANGIHIQDDKIIITGVYYEGSSTYPALARFSASGGLDPDFGNHGHKIIEIPPLQSMYSTSQPSLLEPIPRDKNKDSGISSISTGDGLLITYQYAFSFVSLIKLDSNGEFDRSFNGDGFKLITPPDTVECTGMVTLVGDNEIFLCGLTSTKNGLTPYIACVKRTGEEFKKFGNGGYLLYGQGSPLLFHDLDYINKEQTQFVCIASDGMTKGHLTAFNLEGNKLPGFKDQNTDFGGSGGQWTSGHVDQARGKIITTGSTVGNPDEVDVVVGRFELDGTPDQSFGDKNGWGRVDLKGNFDIAFRSSLEESGKTVVYGTGFLNNPPLSRFGYLLRCKTEV
ncbi:hypothetical protein HU751_013590 [Pseudomonas sp. BW13M1]|uniref:Delta-60 repeat domain-containing protein n=1 Tax=Pseudomonas peradeniyensis TaxID=2745488 RepID=A0A923G5Z7_9PSED|nr:hypothetical protein [Pseudomonas peradeniyensis]MBV4505881.1 hypothetical protein [Pseudomonas peradeniyensis]